MKLKFERFEGLASFSARGHLTAPEVKLLQIGLDSIVKDLESPLVINLMLINIPPALAPVFQAIKKSVAAHTKQKIHWVSNDRSIADFANLKAFSTRLTGSQHRQIGERLILDDENHELNDKFLMLQDRLAQVTGDEKKSHELILQNRTLKEEERILKETIKFQKERIKLQVHVPSVNEELPERMKLARAALKKIYPGIDL